MAMLAVPLELPFGTRLWRGYPPLLRAVAVALLDSEPESLMAEGERGRWLRGEEVNEGAVKVKQRGCLSSYGRDCLHDRASGSSRSGPHLWP